MKFYACIAVSILFYIFQLDVFAIVKILLSKGYLGHEESSTRYKKISSNFCYHKIMIFILFTLNTYSDTSTLQETMNSCQGSFIQQRYANYVFCSNTWHLLYIRFWSFDSPQWDTTHHVRGILKVFMILHAYWIPAARMDIKFHIRIMMLC